MWLKTTALEAAIFLFILVAGWRGGVLPVVAPTSEGKFRGHTLEYWLNEYRRYENAEAAEAITSLRDESLAMAQKPFTTSPASGPPLISFPSYFGEHPLFSYAMINSRPDERESASIV